ncbi:hypothetical protein DFH07DRAFT_941285 [Mycena maculata]|uniref:Uncharacterized protein n=1 Tax=Mycena maculata TaxID=230809 RepID=A0AAD7IYP2_9AGAR|nr:hypothetical protein DFH07DRAFT_941285 [Mycena maculata]
MVAVEKSWVLIDIDDQAEWSCPEIFTTARCIVWTSSPRPRMNNFVKRFSAERWELFGMDQGEILRRMDIGGPVARSLFTVAASDVTTEGLTGDINSALSNNIFNFSPVDNHRVIRIEPLVVIDLSGRARLQRTDYSAEFMSSLIAEKTLDVLQNRFEKLQKQLAATPDIFTTRSLAGNVVEGLIHRSLQRVDPVGLMAGRRLDQNSFGRGFESRVKTTRRFSGYCVVSRVPQYHKGQLPKMGLMSKLIPGDYLADLFSRTNVGPKGGYGLDPRGRPLYLRPKSRNFATVDAILVTENMLGHIQTSLSDGHSRNFGTILRITSRLAKGADVRVNSSWEMIYCFVGTTPEPVTSLVAEAKRTLVGLQMLNAKDLCTQLSLMTGFLSSVSLATPFIPSRDSRRNTSALRMRIVIPTHSDPLQRPTRTQRGPQGRVINSWKYAIRIKEDEHTGTVQTSYELFYPREPVHQGQGPLVP